MSDLVLEHDLTGPRFPMLSRRLDQTFAAGPLGAEFPVAADEPAFAPDIRKWCHRTAHTLVERRPPGGVTGAHLKRSA